MNNIVKEISANWQSYRNHCKSISKTGYEIKTVAKDHNVYDLVINQWRDKVTELVNSEKYLIESSVGIGNLSAAPWLAIMDKSITESAREGFYIVFLFSRSAKKMYLALSLGATQFEIIHGRNNECLDKIKLAANDFSSLFKDYLPSNLNDQINLVEDEETFEQKLMGSSRFLVSAYEAGTFLSKQYDPMNINSNEINEDISNFLNIYKSITNDSRAENLDILAEKFSKKLEKININYQVKEYSPREKNIKKIKSSTVHKAKSKRRTQESKKIGLAGEEYVYQYEYNKLKKIGREDLSNKIIKHFELNQFPGWDITSFDESGNEIFIEVKSTKGTIINNLDITSNEWNAAIENKEKYLIYLVNNALNEKIRIFEIIKNPSEHVNKGNIILSTSVYELKL
jgi:hypothetical protein